LVRGDEIALGDSKPIGAEEDGAQCNIPQELVPVYPKEWMIHVLDGPHDDEEFLTTEGNLEFYSTSWRVSASSNRMGIRLEGLDGIQWARKTGGEGGSHPSNILDNGYTVSVTSSIIGYTLTLLLLFSWGLSI
jgi:urea carboxylase